MMKMLLFVAAMVTSAALVTPTVAEAGSVKSDEQASVTVHFGDLDLTSAKGKARLDRRVHTALRRVCGDPGDRIVRAGADARACIASGKLKAASQVELALANKSRSQVLLSAR